MSDTPAADFDSPASLQGYEYEALMNALNVSVFKCLLNEEFTAIWCNNYFYESTGYTKEEYAALYHYSVRDYFASALPDEYRKIAEIVMGAYARGDKRYTCVSRMPHKNGSFIWIKVVGTFTEEMRDGVPVLYVVYTDITDVVEQQELHRRLEERSELLRAALESAEEANRAKSDFLSRMSHDIRTPLNAILGMTEIADAHLDDPEKMHDCHRKIALSGQHLLGLVNDVLDMSKIESGKMTINCEDVCLPELLENVAMIVQPDIKAKRQCFSIRPRQITAEYVSADALRLRQIFLNLLSNAMKFTPEGGSIVFDIEEAGRPDGETVLLRFTVSDTGIGMKPAFLEHLFEVFTREQDSRVDKTVGSGLGMAITKRIVDRMGGTIEVHSQVGAGTTFQVTLPLKLAAPPRLDDAAFSEYHILLADDDPVVCEYAAAVFQELGIQGECATGGRSALEEWRRAGSAGMPYDVVILDWKMPDLGGLEVARKIREADRDIPILIATAYDRSEIEEEANSAGVSGFLQKPLFRSTICSGLKKCLSGFQAENAEGDKKEFDFSGRRFLLAEDNELNREIAVELLGATGAEIDSACDGEQCLERFAKSPEGYYDLILMDIQMPVMNGYAAAKAIRALPRRDAKKIQIWAMTANAFVEDREAAKAAGMDGHFAKPLDIHSIYGEISRFF